MSQTYSKNWSRMSLASSGYTDVSNTIHSNIKSSIYTGALGKINNLNNWKTSSSTKYPQLCINRMWDPRISRNDLYYVILHMGLEHLRILVFKVGPGTKALWILRDDCTKSKSIDQSINQSQASDALNI